MAGYRRSDLARLSGQLSVEEVFGSVSEMHAAPENEFAFFQAASQFNCLEHSSQRGLPEHGVTCYMHDKTQGPACATTCGPGTIVRNYFAMDGKPQSESNQINNLRLVEEYLDNDANGFFNVKSGYTLSTNSKLRLLGEAVKEPRVQEEVMNRLLIGVQEDTEVTATDFGMCPFEHPEGKKHLVTQAFCSACSVSYSKCSDEAWMPFATLVLRASYEATMHAALQNALRHPKHPGARRVFLTAIGGGVFGNRMEWIESAMREAFHKFRDFGLTIYLVTHAAPSQPEFARLADEFSVAKAEDAEA